MSVMRRAMMSVSVSTIAAAALLVGCSSGDEPLANADQVELATTTTVDDAGSTTTTEEVTTTSAAATSTTAAEGDLTEAAREYLDIVGNNGDARDVAEAGSVAFAYADYLFAVNAAFGNTVELTSSEFDAEGATFTFSDGVTVRYDNLTVSPGGMVAFDVNGIPVSDVLLFDESEQGIDSVVVEYLSSYRSASGSFLVTARIRNNGDTNLDLALYDAAWVSDDGGVQLEPEAWGGSESVRPGAVGTATIFFGRPNVATSAGTLFLDSFLNEFAEPVSYSATLSE